MSIVEQTIARLRRQQGLPPGGMAVGTAPADRARQETRISPAPDAAGNAPPVAVDYAALRALGYRPEAEQERHLSHEFRRIKRPLIEKALSGATTIGEPRVILIASALPGEGKTFTSVNLALSMARERDISVLLIDCDVAKRQVSELFKLQDRIGLVELLENEAHDAERAIVPTSIPNLSILPAGRQAGTTVELLSSNQMRNLLVGLSSRNPRRLLLLDSPPLLVTNEGQALVKLSGQVVLVVRAGATPRQAVEAALTLFDPMQAGGIILNQVDSLDSVSTYGYAYGAYGAGDYGRGSGGDEM